jgi:peptidoglycan/xylan/chitin deacetylase (PgdA/CDA1 family)
MAREMKRERLHVVFTMDCERIREFSPCGGPADWPSSERAIRAYADLLEGRGYRATFFFTPEACERHRRIVSELDGRGFELGLHLHPSSFRDGAERGLPELGFFPYGRQKDLIRDARDGWAQAAGFAPRCFRPGCASANDDTFLILEELGFREGSVSEPERELPGVAAVWRGADPNAHHAHRAFRLVPGDLCFLEVPITVDPEIRPSPGVAQEFGIERGDLATHRRTLEKNLRRLSSEDPPVKTLLSFTHNLIDYSGETDPAPRQTLLGVLDYFDEIGRDGTRQVIPSSLAAIHEQYHLVQRLGAAGR